MLKHLSINNYALIDKLSLNLKTGFTAITGETGAGKSILVSALALITGERADFKAFVDIDKKCIVEAEFNISKYKLDFFFENNDLDFINPTLIRREITPAGRSRAFVNDTPVSLNLLKELGSHLIDIHSQHQTLLINSQNYQLKLVDAYCNHQDILSQFKSDYQSYFFKQKELDELIENENQLSKELDYKQFLFDELEEAKLSLDDKKIEEEVNKLENFKEIQQKLNQIMMISDNSESSVSSLLSNIVINLDSIRKNDSKIDALSSRFNGVWIEFKDCVSDLENLVSYYNIDFDAKQLLFFHQRFSLINKLIQKHGVNTIEDLLEVHSNLSKDLEQFHSLDKTIESLRNECNKTFNKASKTAQILSKNRISILPHIQNELHDLLSNLGMPNATVKIVTNSYDKLNIKGNEYFTFYFTSNNGVEPKKISDVASGGELSRLMLCFKYILAQKTCLPSVIFDEIDTGVSGEIAFKMANLMSQMSKFMQVISITHLPQVAARGSVHLFVSKLETSKKVQINIKELAPEERIVELAKMLSGKAITDSSLSNARDLLNT